MYWEHGVLADLCRGPHLQHTAKSPADASNDVDCGRLRPRATATARMLQRNLRRACHRTKEKLKAAT